MRYFQSFRTMIAVAAVASVPLATAAGADESKTVQEGMARAQADGVRAQADFMEARAQMVNALSQAQKTRAETRKTLEECRTLAIENDMKRTKNFYDKKAAREAYLADHARPRPTPEQLNRYSQAAAPKRLNQVSLVSTRSGVRWPAVFDREEFAPYREQVDLTFGQRVFGDGGIGTPFYRQIHKLMQKMEAELLCLVREVPPMEYVAAKKFLQSMAYEAQRPQVLNGVAAN